MAPVTDFRSGLSAPDLRPLVGTYQGSRISGSEPGSHLVFPSPSIVLVVSLDSQLRVSAPGAREEFDSHPAVVAGPRTDSSLVAHDGNAHDLTVALTPDGARLLGLPAADLANRIVGLEELWGDGADVFLNRVREARGWREQFAVLDDVLQRRLGDVPAPGPISRSWRTLISTGGSIRIADLAAQGGYGRRRFHELFTAEYGVTPKQAGRLIRFQRSVAGVRSNEVRLAGSKRESSLATVAAETGYYDQSHMIREWRELAGCTPTQWLEAEDLPFVQDTGGRRGDNG